MAVLRVQVFIDDDLVVDAESQDQDQEDVVAAARHIARAVLDVGTIGPETNTTPLDETVQ